jgi:hypothetical protein
MKIIPFPGLTAFNESGVIGTRVLSTDAFLKGLAQKIEYAERDGRMQGWQGKVDGHFVIPCPELQGLVSPGIGIRTNDPNDYILVFHREGMVPFLKRAKALSVTDCQGELEMEVILYSFEAFLCDGDVRNTPLSEWAKKERPAYVIIAIHSPASPPTPWRFTLNAAGGNEEYKEFTADELRQKAAESAEFWKRFCTVADPA